MKGQTNRVKRSFGVLFAALFLLFPVLSASVCGVLPACGFLLRTKAVCEAAVASGSCGKQGDSVAWTMYEDGSLVLSGSGETADFDAAFAHPALWNNAERLIVEDGITKLGANSFSAAQSIAAVYLPESLLALGDRAFENCSGISEVYYASSSEHWANIDKGTGNRIIAEATVHFDIREFPAIGHNFDDWTDNGGNHMHTCYLCNLEETADHEWVDSALLKAATCKEEGSKIVSCTVCGKEKTEPIAVDPNNHSDYGTHIENKADATCTKEGYTGDEVCSGCNAILTKGKELPKLSHEFDDWVENGENHMHTCYLCNLEETADHAWIDVDVLKTATCKEAGSKRVRCEDCGMMKTVLVAVDPNNHGDYGTHIENKDDATCTTAGDTGDTVCNGCGATVMPGGVIPALGHDWGAWSANNISHTRICKRDTSHTETLPHNWNSEIEIKKATCKEQGIKQLSCTVCSFSKTEPTAADENNHSDYGTHVENKADATCLKAGYTGDSVCNGCGAVLIAGESISSLGHDWGAWSANGANHIRTCKRDETHIETAAHVWNSGTVTKQPTCSEQGAKRFSCTVCSAAKTEPVAVDPNNHADYGTRIDNVKAADCTETGYTGDTVCSGCGTVLTAGKNIDPLGHDWGGWSVRSESHTRTCKRNANHKETSPHTWSNETVIKKATCCEQGTKLMFCAACGLTNTAAVDADPGNHGDYRSHLENVKTANCSETGYSGDTVCNGCNHVIGKGAVISQNPAKHVLTFVPAVAATAEAEGNVAYYRCALCGKTFSDPEGKNQLTTVATEKLPQPEDGACEYCGKTHTGLFGWLVKIIHSVLAALGLKK